MKADIVFGVPSAAEYMNVYITKKEAKGNARIIRIPAYPDQ